MHLHVYVVAAAGERRRDRRAHAGRLGATAQRGLLEQSERVRAAARARRLAQRADGGRADAAPSGGEQQRVA